MRGRANLGSEFYSWKSVNVVLREAVDGDVGLDDEVAGEVEALDGRGGTKSTREYALGKAEQAEANLPFRHLCQL